LREGFCQNKIQLIVVECAHGFKESTGEFGTDVLHRLLRDARVFILQDKTEHDKALKKAEEERIAALNGKRQGDPKANTGLSRFKKKHGKEIET
jgi:hypothetical protein